MPVLSSDALQLLKLEEPDTCRLHHLVHCTRRLTDLVDSYVLLVAAVAACSIDEQAALQGEQSQLQRVLQTIASNEL